MLKKRNWNKERKRRREIENNKRKKPEIIHKKITRKTQEIQGLKDWNRLERRKREKEKEVNGKMNRSEKVGMRK